MLIPIFKVLHLLSILAWSASLFYVLRLLLYHARALQADEPGRSVLSSHYKQMAGNVWYPVGWTSAVLVLIFGAALMHPWFSHTWFQVKMALVLLLYILHFRVHLAYRKMQKDQFNYSPLYLMQMMNVFAVLMLAIVFLAVLKDHINYVYLTAGSALLFVALFVRSRMFEAGKGH